MSDRKKRLLRRLDGYTMPMQIQAINNGLKDWLVPPEPAPVINISELGETEQLRFAAMQEGMLDNGN